MVHISGSSGVGVRISLTPVQIPLARRRLSLDPTFYGILTSLPTLRTLLGGTSNTSEVSIEKTPGKVMCLSFVIRLRSVLVSRNKGWLLRFVVWTYEYVNLNMLFCLCREDPLIILPLNFWPLSLPEPFKDKFVGLGSFVLMIVPSSP